MPDGQTPAGMTRARRPRSSGCRHTEAIARFNRRELLLPPPTYTSIRQLAPRSVDRRRAGVGKRDVTIPRIMPGFFKNGDEATLTLPGDPFVPDHSRLGRARGDAIRAAGWSPVATPRKPDLRPSTWWSRYFNARRLDLPDGFFDRRAQFVINGAPIETLLSTAPTIRWS